MEQRKEKVDPQVEVIVCENDALANELEKKRSHMAAIKDVAKLAGMSVSVVSKYLKNSKSVRPDTKEKIESAIASLHYVPSPIARSLRTKRTGMVAVVVPSIINPFFAELFESIRLACNKKSLLAILQTVDNEMEIEQTIQSIQSRQVDGVILCFPDQDLFLIQLKDRIPSIPIATMNWHGMETATGNIVLDVKRGIFDTTMLLIQKGCTRIGYIGGPEDSTISKEKFKGFVSAIENMPINGANAIKETNAIEETNEINLHILSEKNKTKLSPVLSQNDKGQSSPLVIGELPFPSNIVEKNEIGRNNINEKKRNNIVVNPNIIKTGKVSMRFGHDAMKVIYEADPLIQAVVCENDALAIGCITYCLHQHIEIPRKISITGYDDIPLAAMFEPSLTTVRLPIDEMGKCAVEMIHGQIEGNPSKEVKIFETKLIVRGTTN